MNYFIITFWVSLFSNSQTTLLQVESSASKVGFVNEKSLQAWRVQQKSTLEIETQHIRLDLPDGVQAILQKKKSYWQGARLHWQGTVQGDPLGQAAFVQKNGTVSGEISVGGRRFVISQIQKQLMIIETRVTDAEGPYKNLPTPDFGALTAVTTPSTDNFIDVMLLYTDDVAVNSDAEEVLRARVDATNEMLAASCANFRYRLVYIGQVSYAETGVFMTDLTALANTSDGVMDSIHTLRDTYGADLVQLVTNAGDACGLGYLGQDGFFNEDYGFSVSLYWCNARTMAHEWGHNLSISHDRYEEDEPLDSQTVLLDGYGFVDMANKYRDVMSYSTQCNDAGVTCTTLDLFSNPRITHNSIAFGIINYADSVSRMNEAFPFVANFRNTINPYTANIDNNCVSNSDNKDLHCFVASTVYKSYHHQNVHKLRRFRDQWLKGSLLGRYFIKSYYKYSPLWAQKISGLPVLSSLIAFGLSAVIFLAENLFYFLILQIFVFLIVLGIRNKKLSKTFFIFAILMISLPIRAQIATPSHFIYLRGQNPSVRLLREAKPFASVQYLNEQKNIESAAYSEESESQKLNLMLAYISSEYFFEIQFSPQRKYDRTTTQAGFADSIARFAEQDYLVQAGSYFFNVPFGFKYQSEKLENLNSLQKTKSRSMGVGTTMELASYLNFGGGVDLRERTGDGLASAQWLQPYLGVAFGQMPQRSINSQGLNEYFIEAGFSRSPEVQNTEGAAVTSLGQAVETYLAAEVSLNTGLASMDQILTRLSSTNRKEKATSYILEEVELKTLSVHLGFTLPYAGSDKLLVSAVFERTERVSSLSDETAYVGLALSYYGQGGSAVGGGSRGYK